MGVIYKNLGGSKRLQEIVFAGSHDASITDKSDSAAQTQDLDVGGQADAGVRLFDIRILAKKDSGGGASLVGYHGSGGGKSTSQFASQHTGKTQNVTTNSKMSYGVTGEKLSKMLNQAKAFVEKTGEFLIFKFDKSTNYKLIADYCIKLLGDNIYKPIGLEFSKLSLDNLSKKVVCVFNDKALKEMKPYTTKDGILGFRSLKGKDGMGVYEKDYPGLQYYGKGGTAWWKVYQTNKMKMKDNEGIQKKMLLAMARQEDDFAANVLGMMYWTSTGFTSSIRDRNENVMWGATGITRMGELWRQGLESSISTQLQRDQIKVLEFKGVKRMKAYFPNIIMIDFADEDKCKTIYDLNTVAEQRLEAAYKKYTKAKG
ncbi:MAG TPA: hypothetical protein VH280_00580 [Verrucomicrobiae bacterium]|jgi:hypothetical protein|nr:hypothetical protein [Verrucomicrobiae bacterium]